MPSYQYICESCGKEFEAVQRMTDPALTDCTCGSKGTVRRLLSAGTGFIFKGSGFYQTDYKSKPASSEAKAESKPAPAGGGHSCGSGCGCGKN